MGSCISKCYKTKKKLNEDHSILVQDKLIISSSPSKMTTMPLENLKKPLSPSPSTSSFSCSTNTTSKRTVTSSSSSESSSSCSSSLLVAKDRSFSNEFLRSCVEDNPQMISLTPNAMEENCNDISFAGVSKIKYFPQNFDPSLSTKQPVQEKATNHVPATKKKRPRASSPTLARQKSFRLEQESSPMPNRALGSPSPSRRFNNVDNCGYVPTNGTSNYYRRRIASKGNNSISSCSKKESFRARTASSPNRKCCNFTERNNDTLISREAGTKIDDHAGIKDMQEMDIVMEDINNPLIALDCFIFL
ncbi:hypothetical protein OROMI_030620 [Orobanche minor]